MKLILLILYCLTLGYCRDVLNKHTGVICGLMKTGKNPTYIDVNINKIVSNEQQVKFPVFILHYTDLLEIASLPNREKYQNQFATDKKSAWNYVYPDTNDIDLENRATFKVKYSNGVEKYTLNKPIVYQGDGIHYNVEKDGLYCVYIAQPLNVESFEAPITFKQSHGNLPYIIYIMYRQSWFVLVLSILVFAYLFYYILRFKVGKDFTNLNSLSIISKATIFYVTFPFIITTSISLLLNFIYNNWIETSSNNFIFNLLNLGNVWLSLTFGTCCKYFILLFSMGFGTVYYFRGNTKNYRELPTKLHQISFYFFIINLVIISLISFTSYQIDHTHNIMDSPFLGVLMLFDLIWVILSIIYYFKTKKLIAKFPPISNTNENSSDLNAEIVKSFRRSILVIFFLPILTTSISMFYYVLRSTDSSIDFSKLPSPAQDPDGDVLSILLAESLENGVLNGPINVLYLNNALNVLLPVIFIYAIWIRTNTGLIIEDDSMNNGYANVSEFIISDEDLQLENNDSNEEIFDDGSNDPPSRDEGKNDNSGGRKP